MFNWPFDRFKFMVYFLSCVLESGAVEETTFVLQKQGLHCITQYVLDAVNNFNIFSPKKMNSIFFGQ